MSGSDNLSKWLLMPSGPDDFLLSSLDIYLPSSGMEIYGMTNDSCPRVFRSKIHHPIVVLPNILQQKGSDY